MMQFASLLRASLVVAAVVASMVCSSDAIFPYVNSATIFGRCDNFSIQAGTTVTFDGEPTNVYTGNVGVSPGTSITGFPILGPGYTEERNTDSAKNCALDEAKAYGILKSLKCTNSLDNSDLSDVTLSEGVYCTDSGAFTLKTSALYLDALGDATAQFIFQTASTVITSENTRIILLNGAQVKNVYWQIGSSATLGGSSSFMGQILTYASITVNTNVAVVGRLYAQAAVTFAGADKIRLPFQLLYRCMEPINTKQTEQPQPLSKVK